MAAKNAVSTKTIALTSRTRRRIRRPTLRLAARELHDGAERQRDEAEQHQRRPERQVELGREQHVGRLEEDGEPEEEEERDPGGLAHAVLYHSVERNPASSSASWASSARLRSMPPPKPVSSPLAPITRWH